jgi:hypothetical protein
LCHIDNNTAYARIRFFMSHLHHCVTKSPIIITIHYSNTALKFGVMAKLNTKISGMLIEDISLCFINY